MSITPLRRELEIATAEVPNGDIEGAEARLLHMLWFFFCSLFFLYRGEMAKHIDISDIVDAM